MVNQHNNLRNNILKIIIMCLIVLVSIEIYIIIGILNKSVEKVSIQTINAKEDHLFTTATVDTSNSGDGYDQTVTINGITYREYKQNKGSYTRYYLWYGKY